MTPAGLDDTSPEATRVQVELLRGFSTARRLDSCMRLTASVVGLSRRALRRARPGASDAEILVEWVALNYGADVAAGFRRRLAEGR